MQPLSRAVQLLQIQKVHPVHVIFVIILSIYFMKTFDSYITNIFVTCTGMYHWMHFLDLQCMYVQVFRTAGLWIVYDKCSLNALRICSAVKIVLYSVYDTDISAENSPRSTPGPKNGGRGAKRRQRQ